LPRSKRKDSAYRSGRSPDWLKMKNPDAPAAATKAEGIAREVERLSHQARAAGLSVTAYILGLAVEEARKEAGTEDGKVQHARFDHHWEIAVKERQD